MKRVMELLVEGSHYAAIQAGEEVRRLMGSPGWDQWRYSLEDMPSIQTPRGEKVVQTIERTLGHDGRFRKWPVPTRLGPQGNYIDMGRALELSTENPNSVYSWSSKEVQRAKRSRNAQRKVMEIARKQGMKFPKRKVGLFLAALTALAGMGYAFGAPEGESA